MSVTSRFSLFSSLRSPGLIVGLAAMALTFPAQADFLDDLFGSGASAPQSTPAPRARPMRPSGRVEFSLRPAEGHKAIHGAVKAAVHDSASATGSKPQKPHFCDAAGQSQTAATSVWLRDETLRAGDSVVTDGSIVVFKGHSACPHTAADFVSVARSDLPKAKRNALATLEQAMRAPEHRFNADGDSAPKVVGQVSE